MTFYQETTSTSDSYQILHEEEAGAFGHVSVCQDVATGAVVAVKYLKKGPSSINDLVLSEVIAHRNLYHPNIMLLRKVILTETALGIVVEHAAGGNLQDYVRDNSPLQEVDARSIFQQIVVALLFLEAKAVGNHGLKIENIMLDKSTPPKVKMTDVGYFKCTEDHLPKSRVGSFGFVAPEVLLNKKDVNQKKADCWSVGIILYQLLYGEHPFEKPSDQEEGSVKRTLDRIVKVQYRLPSHASSTSPEALDLLQHILVEDPAKRYSLQDMQAHPWFQKGLPTSLMRINEECLAMPEPDYYVSQPLDEMVTVIKHAMQPLDDDSFDDGFAADDYDDIDDLMDA
ncbi:g11741 [Coccomyxa elongata]